VEAGRPRDHHGQPGPQPGRSPAADAHHHPAVRRLEVGRDVRLIQKGIHRMRRFAVIAFAAVLGAVAAAQAPAPGTARAVSPIDLTGNWVSIVTEDWRFRMVTPPKGDYASVPLNGAARAIADKWDPAADEAAGNACKSYGAGNIMRTPGR